MTNQHVAYLIMAYNPMLAMKAVINAIEQDWPDPEYKHIYVIFQNQIRREPDYSDTGIDIREYVLEGTWPSLWAFKFRKFMEEIEDRGIPYMLWWDEDDMFPVNYTVSAIEPMQGDEDCVGSWNFWNWECKRGVIRKAKYQSAIGTLAARVKPLRKAMDELFRQYPEGVYSPTCHGALDYCFRVLYADMYEGRIFERGEDDPLRYYHYHSGAQTIGGRKKAEDVDYGWDGYIRKRSTKMVCWKCSNQRYVSLQKDENLFIKCDECNK